MMILFNIIILAWVIIGFLGVVEQMLKKFKINYFMIIFMLFVPFIPLVVKFCKKIF